MADQAISRFPVPEFDQLPEDIQLRITEVQEKAGFVPNVFLALAWRAEEFRAFFAYHDALMEKDTPGLNQAEREKPVPVLRHRARRDFTYPRQEPLYRGSTGDQLPQGRY
jgi:alkylhydroperoxidase family enzyme